MGDPPPTGSLACENRTVPLSLSDYALSMGVDLGHPFGWGGQGVVYDALGGRGALKVLEYNEHCSEHAASLLWRTLSDHPNVLPLWDVAVCDGRLCTLAPRLLSNALIYIQSKRHICVDRLALVLDIVRGLQHIHSHKLEHNDIKGANILVDHWGHAVIGDLDSLATEENRSPFSSTPRWLAPECWLFVGRPPAVPVPGPFGSADMWSLGCTIIELYTHEIPFHDIPARELYGYLCKGGYRTCPDIARKRGLDPPLWQLVLELLNLDPIKRPTAAQFIERLERLIHNEVDACPPQWRPTPSTPSFPDLHRSVLPSETVLPASEDRHVAQTQHSRSCRV